MCVGLWGGDAKSSTTHRLFLLLERLELFLEITDPHRSSLEEEASLCLYVCCCVLLVLCATPRGVNQNQKKKAETTENTIQSAVRKLGNVISITFQVEITFHFQLYSLSESFLKG